MTKVHYTKKELEEFRFYQANGFKPGDLICFYEPDDKEFEQVLKLNLELKLPRDLKSTKDLLRAIKDKQREAFGGLLEFKFINYILFPKTKTLGIRFSVPRPGGGEEIFQQADHRLFRKKLPEKLYLAPKRKEDIDSSPSQEDDDQIKVKDVRNRTQPALAEAIAEARKRCPNINVGTKVRISKERYRAWEHSPVAKRGGVLEVTSFSGFFSNGYHFNLTACCRETEGVPGLPKASIYVPVGALDLVDPVKEAKPTSITAGNFVTMRGSTDQSTLRVDFIKYKAGWPVAKCTVTKGRHPSISAKNWVGTILSIPLKDLQPIGQPEAPKFKAGDKLRINLREAKEVFGAETANFYSRFLYTAVDSTSEQTVCTSVKPLDNGSTTYITRTFPNRTLILVREEAKSKTFKPGDIVEIDEQTVPSCWKDETVLYYKQFIYEVIDPGHTTTTCKAIKHRDSDALPSHQFILSNKALKLVTEDKPEPEKKDEIKVKRVEPLAFKLGEEVQINLKRGEEVLGKENAWTKAHLIFKVVDGVVANNENLTRCVVIARWDEGKLVECKSKSSDWFPTEILERTKHAHKVGQKKKESQVPKTKDKSDKTKTFQAGDIVEIHLGKARDILGEAETQVRATHVYEIVNEKQVVAKRRVMIGCKLIAKRVNGRLTLVTDDIAHPTKAYYLPIDALRLVSDSCKTKVELMREPEPQEDKIEVTAKRPLKFRKGVKVRINEEAPRAKLISPQARACELFESTGEISIRPDDCMRLVCRVIKGGERNSQVNSLLLLPITALEVVEEDDNKEDNSSQPNISPSDASPSKDRTLH